MKKHFLPAVGPIDDEPGGALGAGDDVNRKKSLQKFNTRTNMRRKIVAGNWKMNTIPALGRQRQADF